MKGLFFFQEGVDIQDETDWFFFLQFYYNLAMVILILRLSF